MLVIRTRECLDTKYSSTLLMDSNTMDISSMNRRKMLGSLGLGLASTAIAPHLVIAQASVATSARAKTFSSTELVSSGHRFFGSVSRGLASVVEEATSRWGEPTGYILGQEAAGAFVGGLRYGEGTVYTRNRGDSKIFWQGPSLGFDFGGDGDRTMMLIYKMRNRAELLQRFGGIDGSAYFIGGFGMTALTANNIVIVPIRSGVGARLGINVGYLKFTDAATWNPF
jgi:hypothetical protein